MPSKERSQTKTVETRRWFDRASESADFELRIAGGYHGYLRRLGKIAAGLSGPAILEVGAGAGRFSVELKERGFEIVATDISPDLLRILGKRDSRIPCVLADAHNLPFRDKVFDAVFSCDVLEHLVNPQRTIQEQARICKKQGTILAIVPNRLCPFYLRNFLRERYWWRFGTPPFLLRPSLKGLAANFRNAGLQLRRLDTFGAVPVGASGGLFRFLRRIETSLERIPPIRVIVGLIYVQAENR